jgi:ethanolamine phosphate phosphodiesterase
MSRILSKLWFTARQPLNGLRIIWVLTILWNELGVFYTGADCQWPGPVSPVDSLQPNLTVGQLQDHPSRVLIVADPQILDHRSYHGRSWYMTALSQFIVDLNIRKSWRAARRTKPHAVVVLGDMMDGGRFAMDDDE